MGIHRLEEVVYGQWQSLAALLSVQATQESGGMSTDSPKPSITDPPAGTHCHSSPSAGLLLPVRRAGPVSQPEAGAGGASGAQGGHAGHEPTVFGHLLRTQLNRSGTPPPPFPGLASPLFSPHHWLLAHGGCRRSVLGAIEWLLVSPTLPCYRWCSG